MGVVSSVVILYTALYGKIVEDTFKILALSVGFAILVYSFFLILGYGFKKKKLERIIRNNNNVQINGEDNLIQRKLGQILRRSWYPRVKCIGELVLAFIIGGYAIFFIYSFGYTAWIIVGGIIVIFSLLCILANLLR